MKSSAGNPFSIFLIILSVAFQVQITLFATEDYLGLRINLADFFLPFMLAYALYGLLWGGRIWPRWQMKRLYLSLAGLLIVLTLALINGYLHIGYWSGWAVVNKYFGFIILCAYLFLGGVIVQNTDKPKVAYAVFMESFCTFFLAILSLSAVLVLCQGFTIYYLWLPDFAWDGFMANRNAYMIVMVFVAVYLLTTRTDYNYSRQQWKHHLFWFLLPVFCLYNASRTGWIVLACCIALYLCFDSIKKLRVVLPFLMLGILLAVFSFYVDEVSITEKKRQFFRLVYAPVIDSVGEDEIAFSEGDQQRLLAVEDGLELYWQSNPLIGAGLGAYKQFQIEKRGKFLNLIDFTALWLLVEAGLLGVMAFGAFFGVSIKALYDTGWKQSSPFHKTMFFYLIIFAAMTFMHELMYSRYIWFAMGMALTHYVYTNPEVQKIKS